MHLLLSGSLPFFAGTNEEVLKKVERGNVTFACKVLKVK
jgi:hypothetical protein